MDLRVPNQNKIVHTGSFEIGQTNALKDRSARTELILQNLQNAGCRYFVLIAETPSGASFAHRGWLRPMLNRQIAHKTLRNDKPP
ncbi:MAG: hypothetical protein DMG12_18485 [Acidobacteria bacterium]|nr:MAG: hypothetical protein DMG12_18485 [Acidobacteriota bacterium]